MLNKVIFIFIGIMLLFSGRILAQDATIKPSRGVFSIGIHPNIVLNNYENLDKMGNPEILSKRHFAETYGYDKDGKKFSNLYNYYIGGSAMYRLRPDKNNHAWAFEVQGGYGKTSYSYNNIRQFAWGTGYVLAWGNNHSYSRFSFTIHRTWGENGKWYGKLGLVYNHLIEVNKQTADYTNEWINNDTVGGIWKLKILARNNFCLVPEIGRQFTFGKNKNTIFQLGLAYSMGTKDLYHLQYYSVFGKYVTGPNTIVEKGNYLSLNLSLYLPVKINFKTHKSEKIKPQKPEQPAPAARQYTQNNLVFLVDVSVSMNAEDKLLLLKQYIIKMLDSLPPDDYITIVTFSGSAAVILQPTQVKDRDVIEEKLQNLTVHGNTDINRGLEKAYEILNQNHIYEGNNRIIMATDGEFRASPKTKELIKNNFESKNKIVLSVFHFLGNTVAESSTLAELAALGGGNYATVNKNNIDTKLESEYRQKAK